MRGINQIIVCPIQDSRNTEFKHYTEKESSVCYRYFSFTLLVPYACTGGGGAVTGLTSCMNVPSTISTTYLETLTAGAALLGNIDRTSNMRNDKIWIFDGTADTKVNPGMYRLGLRF